MHEWIDVNDRLPDKDCEVEVKGCCSDYCYFSLKYYSEPKFWVTDYIYDQKVAEFCYPTHWRPIDE